MIISITLKNVLSYRDETTFSLVAGKITKQHVNHVTRVGDLPILRGAIIYGPNAAGKSNLLKAMRLFQFMLDVGTCGRAMGNHFKFFSQKLSEHMMSWTIVVERSGFVFRYMLETNGLFVSREKLEQITEDGARLLFDRRRLRVEFGDELQGEAWYANRSFPVHGLLLSKMYDDGLVDRKDEIAFGTVMAAAVEGVMNFEVLDSSAVPSVGGLVKMFEMDEFKDFLKQLLRVADLGIEDIFWRPCSRRELDFLSSRFLKVEKQADLAATTRFIKYHGSLWALIVREGKTRAYELRFVHQGVPMPMGDESEGTIRLFELSVFLYSLKNGDKTWFVDEIDCHMHPFMAHHVIDMFMGLPETRAQVIMTAHDTSLMTHDLWRTDEVWFAEKRGDGSTGLYSLYQYAPRFDKKLEKGYRQGLYGAIPHIGGEMLDG